MKSTRSTLHDSRVKPQQDQAPPIPYDQLPYTYYADKFLTSILPWRKYYLGMDRDEAVQQLAEAMEGTPHAVLRLFELKKAKVTNYSIVAVLDEPKNRQFFGTIELDNSGVTKHTFAHEAAHLFDYFMSGNFNPRHASSISSSVNKEYEEQLRLYTTACREGTDASPYAMNWYAMTHYGEFAAEEIRGSWKVHNPRLDPNDKHGEDLRNYAIERGPETVKYYDAHLQALKNYLDKDPANINLHIDLNAIKRDAKAIRNQTEISAKSTLQGASSMPSEPQIDDPDLIRSASPVPPLAPLLPERKGKQDKHSHHPISSRHNQAVKNARAGTVHESR